MKLENKETTTQKILILITHSLGEIDVLFPLIAAIADKFNVQIEIVFTVKDIFGQFSKNDFYLRCAEKLKCKTVFKRFPNKFDKDFRRFKSVPFGNTMLRLYFFFISMIATPWLRTKIRNSDICMHEFSNQLSSTKILYNESEFIDKKRITYSHGHSFTIDTKAFSKSPHADQSLFLMFHENDRQYIESLGYMNIYTIGYPKFYPEWTNLLKAYSGSSFEGESIALVYSRHIHDLYMDKDKYQELIISTCSVIRKKMGGIKIVIKPHPREDKEEILHIVRLHGFSHVYVSEENAGILAKSAKIAVSFWTSAILDSLSLGVPSVEYYIEADRFREIEPEGSAYKKVGIDSVDNRADLAVFFDRVLEGVYEVPEIIKQIRQGKDIGFLIEK